MNVVGISAFFHDAACCLLQDGKLVAAAAQERFSRRKHDRRLPVDAFVYCLREGGIDVSDVDCVAYYEQPVKKLARQLWAGHARDPAALDPRAPLHAIRQGLGFEGPIRCFDHALSHAASAYCYSGFDESALLTMDAVGEWTTIGYGHAHGNHLELFDEVQYPHSLGLLYSTLTAYLGFRVNSGEYKLMGLAAYGKPRFCSLLERLIEADEGAAFRLNTSYFDFGSGANLYSPALVDLLGVEPRDPEQAPTPEHADLACSIQRLLEDQVLSKARWLRTQTGSDRLCFAGGVALNCVANGRVRREGPFAELFVPPAPGDDGGALGAAALAQIQLSAQLPGRLQHSAWGPRWQGAVIRRQLSETPLPGRIYGANGDGTGRLLKEAARRLADGQIVGWFHGPMEFGPRALGSRSILADPRSPSARERLNRQIKKREDFRPFAPSVLAEHAPRWFDLGGSSPFMQETAMVLDPEALPAVTHVDGTARVQTVTSQDQPRFARLLQSFHEITGCPVLLNTSFNVRGEPIVCSPADALRCFVTAGLDALVLEDCLIERGDVPELWPELLAHDRTATRAEDDRPARSNLYTFA